MDVHPGDLPRVISLVAETARRYVGELEDAPVRAPDVGADLPAFREGLPEDGDDALATLQTLIDEGTRWATRSTGPRFFHFVIGGTTPAALGADWIASLLDQSAFAGWPPRSPLGSRC